MPDDLKPYRMVRAVGQEAFEAECCRMMELGYLPAGSPTMMAVVHPLTQQTGAGFMQAMYRPMRVITLSGSKPDLKIC